MTDTPSGQSPTPPSDGSSTDGSPPDAPETEKSVRPLAWIVAGIVIVVLVVVAVVLITGGDDPDPGSESETTDPDPDTDSETGTAAGSGSGEGFGDGTHLVGEDIEPGTYRSTAEETFCYWARVSDLTGEEEDILASALNTPDIVSIDPDDVGFETHGCGEWLPVEDTFPDEPAASFEDGTFVVGEHIEPGTYTPDGDNQFCYWARLANFGHDFADDADGVIENGIGPRTVEIESDDAGFSSFGCGTWTP